jgi:hypothetical protein
MFAYICLSVCLFSYLPAYLVYTHRQHKALLPTHHRTSHKTRSTLLSPLFTQPHLPTHPPADTATASAPAPPSQPHAEPHTSTVAASLRAASTCGRHRTGVSVAGVAAGMHVRCDMYDVSKMGVRRRNCTTGDGDATWDCQGGREW